MSSSSSDANLSDAPSKTYPAYYNAIAGAMAGAGSRVFTAPLDLLRIRRQLSRASYPRESLYASAKSIVQLEGGLTALFRGNLAAMYLWIGYASVQFTVYNHLKELASQIFVAPTQEGNLPAQTPSIVSFTAGASAGVCATLASYPFDVCRTAFAAKASQPTAQTPMPFSSLVDPSHMPPSSQRQIHNGPKSLGEFSIQLYRQKGFRGFYAGAGPAIVGIIPYMGLSFTLYEALIHAHDDQESKFAAWLSGYAGSISGGVSKTIVFPLDTVKRRLQAQAFYESVEGKSYNNMLDCVQKIYHTEGVTGFYRGVVPSVLKTMLGTGLTFGIFRMSRNALEHFHDGHFLG